MKRAILFGCLALAVVSVLPVSASTFLAMDQSEMVAQSEAIVVGRVLQIDSFWNAERTMIVTQVSLEVLENVVGRTDATVVTIRTYGGQVENYRIEAHGFPVFTPGERVLVFLRQDEADPQAYAITGYRLGQYSLVRHANGRTTAVPTLEAGVNLLKRDGSVSPRPQARDLDELKSQLRSLAASSARTLR